MPNVLDYFIALIASSRRTVPLAAPGEPLPIAPRWIRNLSRETAARLSWSKVNAARLGTSSSLVNLLRALAIRQCVVSGQTQEPILAPTAEQLVGSSIPQQLGHA